jgi:hypothetical protein
MTCDYRSHQFVTFLPVSRSHTAKIRPLGLSASIADGFSPGWNKAGHPLPCGRSSATVLTCVFSSQHFSSYPASSRSDVPSLCPPLASSLHQYDDQPGRSVCHDRSSSSAVEPEVEDLEYDEPDDQHRYTRPPYLPSASGCRCPCRPVGRLCAAPPRPPVPSQECDYDADYSCARSHILRR